MISHQENAPFIVLFILDEIGALYTRNQNTSPAKKSIALLKQYSPFLSLDDKNTLFDMLLKKPYLNTLFFSPIKEMKNILQSNNPSTTSTPNGKIPENHYKVGELIIFCLSEISAIIKNKTNVVLLTEELLSFIGPCLNEEHIDLFIGALSSDTAYNPVFSELMPSETNSLFSSSVTLEEKKLYLRQKFGGKKPEFANISSRNGLLKKLFEYYFGLEYIDSKKLSEIDPTAYETKRMLYRKVSNWAYNKELVIYFDKLFNTTNILIELNDPEKVYKDNGFEVVQLIKNENIIFNSTSLDKRPWFSLLFERHYPNNIDVFENPEKFANLFSVAYNTKSIHTLLPSVDSNSIFWRRDRWNIENDYSGEYYNRNDHSMFNDDCKNKTFWHLSLEMIFITDVPQKYKQTILSMLLNSLDSLPNDITPFISQPIAFFYRLTPTVNRSGPRFAAMRSTPLDYFCRNLFIFEKDFSPEYMMDFFKKILKDIPENESNTNTIMCCIETLSNLPENPSLREKVIILMCEKMENSFTEKNWMTIFYSLLSSTMNSTVIEIFLKKYENHIKSFLKKNPEFLMHWCKKPWEMNPSNSFVANFFLENSLPFSESNTDTNYLLTLIENNKIDNQFIELFLMHEKNLNINVLLSQAINAYETFRGLPKPNKGIVLLLNKGASLIDNSTSLFPITFKCNELEGIRLFFENEYGHYISPDFATEILQLLITNHNTKEVWKNKKNMDAIVMNCLIKGAKIETLASDKNAFFDKHIKIFMAVKQSVKYFNLQQFIQDHNIEHFSQLIKKLKEIYPEHLNHLNSNKNTFFSQKFDVDKDTVTSYKKDIPAIYLCPLTHTIMNDPVILVETGDSYERKALIKWFKKNNTDPKSKKILTNQTFSSNNGLKEIINTWVKKNKIENNNNEIQSNSLKSSKN